MIRVENALKMVLNNIRILDSEPVKITGALNRVLAEDIYSDSSVPTFDNSAMDGYAVKSIDTARSLRKAARIFDVIDTLKAGDVSKKILKRNQAIRIMTGAMLPKGADSVVMVEDTKSENRRVEIFKEMKKGENVRKAGEDIQKEGKIIGKGALLKAAHIGILASVGIQKIKVVKMPKVAVLATGDELIDLGKRLLPGKLYSSNTYSLCGQIRASGAMPKDLGIAKDNAVELERKIKRGFDCDIILTSGGVSVGDYDMVKSVLAKIGTDLKFWRVAMKPGKPLVFGKIRGIPVFGLPGNPVSSMVSFEIFVRPAILKMLGRKGGYQNEVEAVLEESIAKKKGLKYFLRARTRWENGSYITRTTGAQGSGILKSMALANSLIILPEEEVHIEKGEKVTIWFLN